MLLVTAEAMRALDERTIAGGHATGPELMRRAGEGVVEAIERRYGSLLGLRALVLCGTGNNGGDGMIAARRLRERGAMPRLVVAGDPKRMSGDAAAARDEAEAAGLAITAAGDDAALRAVARSHDHWDFALDALLGTGARGAPEGVIAEAVQLLRELDETGTRVIAVDLPTGVDADTGAIARRAVRADLTVTFGSPKRGHVLYPGRAFAGTLEVVDIGLAAPEPGDPAASVTLATSAEMAHWLPRRDPRAHKGSAGRVLVVGGSAGLAGAVCLTARAASRAGAGYVHVAIPESLLVVVAVKLTEQVLVPCPETPARSLAVTAWDTLAPLFERVDVVAIGPGLSRDDASAALARRIASECPKPVVVDADALSALVNDPALVSATAGARVLTPHLGEMSRLTGIDVARLEATRIDVARPYAAQWQATILLKGAPTVIVAPDGRTLVNPTGNPGMATQGMGDVLTGVVAALMAQGIGAFEATGLAAWVHGVAGDRVAGRLGARGMTAGDVVEALPESLRALEQERDAATARGATTGAS